MSPEEVIAGGNGTVKVKGPATITGNVAAFKCHTDCPNIVLHRELTKNETSSVFGGGTEITDDYVFGGSTLAADDFVKSSGQLFGRIVLDTDEEITIIKADFNVTIE